MSEKSVSEELMASIACQICHHLTPNTEYYLCVCGHNVCAKCDPLKQQRCPKCPVFYSYNSLSCRNRVLEQIIAKIPTRAFKVDLDYSHIQAVLQSDDGHSAASMLACPICNLCLENTVYFVCPAGHHICEPCQPKVKGRCPQCMKKYHTTPRRNLMIENIIKHDPALKAACRRALEGCTFIGNQAKRARHSQWGCWLPHERRLWPFQSVSPQQVVEVVVPLGGSLASVYLIFRCVRTLVKLVK